MITHARHDASALDDTRLAAALAAGAGEALLRLRAEAGADVTPDRLAGLRASGDATAQGWLAAALSEARPGDSVLSEEAADDPRRLAAARVWIIDPLDGTREFAEPADGGGWRDDFAVHVALWERAAGLVAGAVALPACGVVLSSGEPLRPDPSSAGAVLRGERRAPDRREPQPPAGDRRARSPRATTSSSSRWARWA